MPFSSDFKKIPTLLKLYFLPSIVLLLGIISYGLIHTKVQRGFYHENLPIALQSNLPSSPLQPNLLQENPSYKVAVSVLNVRTKATTNSAIKTRLYRSEIIEVLEVQEGWGRIDGGWVLLAYLERA